MIKFFSNWVLLLFCVTVTRVWDLPKLIAYRSCRMTVLILWYYSGSPSMLVVVIIFLVHSFIGRPFKDYCYCFSGLACSISFSLISSKSSPWIWDNVSRGGFFVSLHAFNTAKLMIKGYLIKMSHNFFWFSISFCIFFYNWGDWVNVVLS